MSEEVSQVIEFECKGVYYLLRGTRDVIASMISGIRALNERDEERARQEYLDEPGPSSWLKIQQVSDESAPVIEMPKEMMELGGLFEQYCEESGLRYCLLPDMNPEDDYVPVGIPSQDLPIHQKQIKSWMEGRKTQEEDKDKAYDTKIQEKEEEIANARTDEEKESLKGELKELKEAKEENKGLLEETKDKMEHDNTITFEEYLRQAKGTNFEKAPKKALEMEKDVGIIRQFSPEECMVPIRDEDLVPESKEIFYSQKTADDKLFTVKRTFETDSNGLVFSEYSVTDAEDPSIVRYFSDKGMSKSDWSEKLPELLKCSGMMAGQPTTALSTEDRMIAYIKSLDGNFTKAREEGREKSKEENLQENTSKESPEKGEKTEKTKFSSKEAEDYVTGAVKDKAQADRFEESRVETITVPSKYLMSDLNGKMAMELGDGLVTGLNVTKISEEGVTLSFKPGESFEQITNEGNLVQLKGINVMDKIDRKMSMEQEPSMAAKATMHHGARR